MPPHYVQEIVTEEGSFPPDIPGQRQIISQEAANTTAYVLRTAISEGTGKHAEIPGYQVAGKTGTAQLVEHGRYSHSKMVTSFAAFAPLRRSGSGCAVSAVGTAGCFLRRCDCHPPRFARLGAKVLPYLDVKRREEEVKDGLRLTAVPDAGGLSPADAEALLRRFGFKVGGWWATARGL